MSTNTTPLTSSTSPGLLSATASSAATSSTSTTALAVATTAQALLPADYSAAYLTYVNFHDELAQIIYSDLEKKWLSSATNANGVTEYTIKIDEFKKALNALLEKYSLNSSSPSPSAVLYPAQSTGAKTAVGTNWESARQFAVQAGLMGAAEYTSVPSPLPDYIKQLPDGNYVVTVSTKQITKLLTLLGNVSPLKLSDETAFTQWSKSITQFINNRYNPTTPDNIWVVINQLMSNKYPGLISLNSMLADTYARMDKLQKSYLDPYLNILKKHNDYYSLFSSRIVSKMAGWTTTSSDNLVPDDPDTAQPVTVFNVVEYEAALKKLINDFYGANPPTSASLKVDCVLYPPQKTSKVTGVSFTEIKNWALNMSYISKDQSTTLTDKSKLTTDLEKFIKELSDGTFVIIENPQELMNLVENIPANRQSAAISQAFNTLFQDNKAKIEERGSLHAQDAQRVHNDFNNQASINSSINKSFGDEARNVIRNI